MIHLIFSAPVVIILLSHSVLSSAQPAEPARSTPSSTIPTEWKTLQTQVGKQEFTDTSVAIARYTEFYEQRGHLNNTVSIQITSRIAQLYAQVLGNREKALEIYAWAVPKYGKYPGGAQLRREQQQLLGGEKAKVATVGPATPVVPAMPAQPGSMVFAPGAAKGKVALPGPIEVLRMTVPSTKKPELLPPAPVTGGLKMPVVVALPPAPGNGEMKISEAVALPPAPGNGEMKVPAAVAPGALAPALSLPTTQVGAPRLPEQSLTPTVVPQAKAPEVTLPKAHSPEVDATGAMGRATLVAQLQLALADKGTGGLEAIAKLWQGSKLGAADLIEILTGTMVAGEAHNSVRLALAGLLAQHGGKALEDTAKLPSRVQLALADYYAGVGDEKAVPLYEILLSAVKQDGPQPRWVFELESLANFHKAKGRLAEAAATLAAVESYSTMPDMRGNVQISAARLYRRAGDDDKANALYTKIQKEGGTWAWGVGLAIWDQANWLIGKDRHKEARALLDQPLQGRYADQIKIGLLAMRAYSYYRNAEWEAARRASLETVAYFKTLGETLKGEDIEAQVEAAQGYLALIDQWQKTPLIAEPAGIEETVPAVPNPAAPKTTTRRFTVSMHRAVPLTVAVEGKGLKATLVEKPPLDQGTSCEQQVIVEWATADATAGIDAAVIVTSSKGKTFRVRVPVKIAVQAPAAEVEEKAVELTTPEE